MVLVLKGSGTEVAQLRVQPLPIIKHFHVLKQLSSRFLLRFVDNIHALYLQGGKPTLSRRIVVAVPRGAHARQDLPGSQHPLIVTTGILAAAIRVVDEPRTGSTATRCHTQGGQNEMATPVIANRPADNETRVKVDDNRLILTGSSRPIRLYPIRLTRKASIGTRMSGISRWFSLIQRGTGIQMVARLKGVVSRTDSIRTQHG